MTGQDLRRPVDHFLGNGGAIVQARRRYCYRLRPESKEMVHRFIGVGESVAGLERGNDLEYFDNDSADALRNPASATIKTPSGKDLFRIVIPPD